MASHLENLLYYIPNLTSSRILDLGSGRGRFLLEARQKGADIIGVEPYDQYIEETQQQAKKLNVEVTVIQGTGEHIPLPSNTFDFVNMAEVIEHVDDPSVVMKEVYRVLRTGGKAYVSVPNRYSLKDQHFGLYGVNWLPRFFSNYFISLFGAHKDYSKKNGRQRLSEMHYYTFGGVQLLMEKCFFYVQDAREIKLQRRYSGLTYFIIRTVYIILKPWYFDSFHLLITK